MAWQESYTLESDSELTLFIETENLSVNVTGNETNTITINLDVDVRSDETNKQKYISTEQEHILKFLLDKEKGTLHVTADEDVLPSNSSLKTPIMITLPQTSQINASTEQGNIVIKSMVQAIKAESENGNIRLDNCVGSKRIGNENGGIYLTSCEGECKLSTENGPVKLVNNTGSIRIDGENGPVKLSGCQGDNLQINSENGPISSLNATFNTATLQNENGSIYYEFNITQEGEYSFKNENGLINLVIPDEIPLHLHAKTEWGRVHMGLEGSYQKEKKDDHNYYEMLRGMGKVKVTVENENGTMIFQKEPSLTKNKKLDFDRIGETLDNAFANFPHEFDREKIKQTLKTAMGKIPSLTVDLSSSIVSSLGKTLDAVARDAKEDFSLAKEDLGRAKEEILKAKEKIMASFQSEKETQQSADQNQREKQKSATQSTEYKEASQLKILQLLAEGKISVDDAEKLLKALGE